MFEKLLDLIFQAGSGLLPFRVVPVAKMAAVLRLGKFHRTCAPGFHWKLPFIEEFMVESTAITTVRLDPQTLTTIDDVSIVVASIIKYQIVDVEKYVTQCWDQVDVVRDVTMGAIRKQVCADRYDTTLAEEQERRILSAVRDEVNRFGFKIHKITFTDLAKVKTLRLMTHAPLDSLT